MIIFNAIGILLITIKKLKKMPSNADKPTFLNHNYNILSFFMRKVSGSSPKMTRKLLMRIIRSSQIMT